MTTYQTCSLCREHRDQGDLELATLCEPCKGTGIIRNPASYVCNGCGGTMGAAPDGLPHPMGLVDASVSGGFCSPHLTDLVTYTFSLCEACLRRLFGEFMKVPPAVFCGISGGDFSYKDDVRRRNPTEGQDSSG